MRREDGDRGSRDDRQRLLARELPEKMHALCDRRDRLSHTLGERASLVSGIRTDQQRLDARAPIEHARQR